MLEEQANHLGGRQPDDVGVRSLEAGDKAAPEPLHPVGPRLVAALAGRYVPTELVEISLAKPHSRFDDATFEHAVASLPEDYRRAHDVVAPN